MPPQQTTEDSVEIKLLRRIVKYNAKAGDVVKVPQHEADSLVKRGGALLYDDKQKAKDHAAEAAAKAAKAAQEALEHAQNEAGMKKKETDEEQARARERIAPAVDPKRS